MGACAIPDPDNEEVIITGGYYTKTTVSVYNKAGHQRDLANLNAGRRSHACTSFIYQDTKVLMVTGGEDSGYDPRDNTEVYKDGVWTTVSQKLPTAIFGNSATTISGNKVLMFGGYDASYSTRNDILEYDPVTEEWQEVGQMKEPRFGHAVSVVSFKDFAAWCE